MNLAKRREYAKNVRELAKNSLRVKESAIVEERRTPSAFVLDMAALYEHGNAYMKEGNRHIAKQGQRIVPSVLNPKDTSIDYLKERRLRNG